MGGIEGFVDAFASKSLLRFVNIHIAGHAEAGVLDRSFGLFLRETFSQGVHGGFVGQIMSPFGVKRMHSGLYAAVIIANDPHKIENILALGAAGIGLEFQADIGADLADLDLLDDPGAMKVQTLDREFPMDRKCSTNP